MNKITILGLIAMLALCSALVIAADDSEGASGETCSVLIDSGNGDTCWSDVTYLSDNTIGKVLQKAASRNDMKYVYSGSSIIIDGLSISTVGGGNGDPSFTKSGTSSVKVTCIWHLYVWEDSDWKEISVSNVSSAISYENIAIGFYPDDCVPTDTPDVKNSWVMYQGDSAQTGNQTTTYSAEDEGSVIWSNVLGGQRGVYDTILVADGYVIVKYGTGMESSEYVASLVCYDAETGDEKWSFTYPALRYYETATPVVVSGYVYLQTTTGYIFKIPLEVAQKDLYDSITTFNGVSYNDTVLEKRDTAIPYETGATLVGSEYTAGPGSLIYDSGCIYCSCSNGMVYCFSLDLELIWSYQTGGHTYYTAPTIVGDHLYAGALNGYLYVLNKYTGEEIVTQLVYQVNYHGSLFGSVANIHAFESDDGYDVIVAFNSGRGMNATSGGMAVYSFNGTELTQVFYDSETFGLTGNSVSALMTDSFIGVVFDAGNGLYLLDVSGNYTLLNDTLYSTHAAITVVNDKHLYITSYSSGNPTYILNTEGKILYYFDQPKEVTNYCMSPAVVMGDYVYLANDEGMYCVYGEFNDYVASGGKGMQLYQILAIVLIVVLVILAALYCVLRFAMKKDKPFKFIGDKFRHYIFGEDISHNTKARHRLKFVLLIGLTGTLLMFIACLCMGPGSIMSVPDMFGNLFSAISKGGQNLTYEELAVYNSRLPRTLAALAVGIGLSIAGAMYQAIIRNPLVDPYIMGVSAGAGTAAVAVIAFDFTFFGLFAASSVYLVALTAMVGGVVAFAITMFLAEKAGGSSVNYVLAGVVVGLAFSAVQTLMLSLSGEHLTDSISWLFGSFANINWTQVWLVVIPAITMSLVPLIWAKEFNLVLLGEDQAKQMGLDVVRFNRIMLILASILTSVCVAFCGIIGFVGLVIPHLCRMVLGGDHRLVLPASIAFGGILMMGADLLARMMMYGQELPVGAITTIIGVPVFAYLLIKRGRMYDG